MVCETVAFFLLGSHTCNNGRYLYVYSIYLYVIPVQNVYNTEKKPVFDVV